MLVLRRRPGECLMIGSDIEIEVLESSAQSVKIGIRAPRQVTILRKELQLTKLQNHAAATSVLLTHVPEILKKL